MRIYSQLDEILFQFDYFLHAGHKDFLPISTRQNPAVAIEASQLSETERIHSAGLMRVNHVGEVCAQALYQGQAMSARDLTIYHALKQASQEEFDHLVWCHTRLHELDSHISFLCPVWYSSALLLGFLAGLWGDAYSLGFLEETEKQVEAHLTHHLSLLPVHDKSSRLILEQMRLEESQHSHHAHELGAVSLPHFVTFMMKCTSKFMTYIAYYV